VAVAAGSERIVIMRWICVAALLGTALAEGTAWAQSLRRLSNAQPQSPLSAGAWLAPTAAQTITQSISPTIVAGNSTSCDNGPPAHLHSDNSYYRAFVLSNYANLDLTHFRVDSVTFGVERANDGDGLGQPLTVNIYKSTSNPPLLAALNLLATANTTIPDSASGTLFTVDIASRPVLTAASDILVVEIFTPSGQTTGNAFVMGSNAGGQGGASFIRAGACGINEITNLAAVSFPNMHLVMSVGGNTQTPVDLQSFMIE
jgi:hypothetical protein